MFMFVLHHTHDVLHHLSIPYLLIECMCFIVISNIHTHMYSIIHNSIRKTFECHAHMSVTCLMCVTRLVCDMAHVCAMTRMCDMIHVCAMTRLCDMTHGETDARVLQCETWLLSVAWLVCVTCLESHSKNSSALAILTREASLNVTRVNIEFFECDSSQYRWHTADTLSHTLWPQ